MRRSCLVGQQDSNGKLLRGAADAASSELRYDVCFRAPMIQIFVPFPLFCCLLTQDRMSDVVLVRADCMKVKRVNGISETLRPSSAGMNRPGLVPNVEMPQRTETGGECHKLQEAKR